MRVLTYMIADGEVDAAEIDRDIISARLQQDVMEHAGKVHLFVADSVRALSLSLQSISLIFFFV